MTWLPWRLALAIVGTVAVVVPAGLAWACVGVVSLTNSSPSVQPGDTLTVRAREFAAKIPVDIRLDSLSGPVLVTAPGPDSTMNSNFTIDVPIPADISGGRHILVATQDHHDMNSGAPARTVFYVGTTPPAPAGPQARPVGMEAASGPSLTSVILIGLAAAIAGLLVAGAWSMLAVRRSPRAEAEVVAGGGQARAARWGGRWRRCWPPHRHRRSLNCRRSSRRQSRRRRSSRLGSPPPST